MSGMPAVNSKLPWPRLLTSKKSAPRRNTLCREVSLRGTPNRQLGLTSRSPNYQHLKAAHGETRDANQIEDIPREPMPPESESQLPLLGPATVSFSSGGRLGSSSVQKGLLLLLLLAMVGKTKIFTISRLERQEKIPGLQQKIYDEAARWREAWAVRQRAKRPPTNYSRNSEKENDVQVARRVKRISEKYRTRRDRKPWWRGGSKRRIKLKFSLPRITNYTAPEGQRGSRGQWAR